MVNNWNLYEIMKILLIIILIGLLISLQTEYPFIIIHITHFGIVHIALVWV